MEEFYGFINYIINFFSTIAILAILFAVFLAFMGIRAYTHRLTFYHEKQLAKDREKIPAEELLLIQKIESEIEDFSAIYFKEFAFNQLITLHHAFENRNLEIIRDDECNALLNMHNIQIKEWINNKEIPIYEQHELVKATLLSYKKELDKEILSVLLNVNLVCYLLNEETGELIEGSKKPQPMRFRMEFIKSQDVSFYGENKGTSFKCPRCGALVSVEISDKCEHCGVEIKNHQYCWLLNEINEN